ncbi:Hpt domain-containing protein [Shewanella hanedai]|uniref:Hpt domain-containing protein n=1 Tax=Shewanella hanedai TaxID=25 RepID=UPI00227A0E3C|nr:Hpt domain-containing protein [Shewanella hanedai]
MLNLFYDEYLNVEQDILQSKKQRDFDHLHRLFHTIKSSAASLGEITLSRLAEQLEKLTNELLNHIDKENSEMLEQQIPLFIAQLNSSLTSLSVLKKEQKKTHSTSKIDDSQLIKKLISQLNQLLDDDNAAAESIINKLRTTSVMDRHNDALESILMEIQDVNYSNASKQLTILAQQIDE